VGTIADKFRLTVWRPKVERIKDRLSPNFWQYGGTKNPGFRSLHGAAEAGLSKQLFSQFYTVIETRSKRFEEVAHYYWRGKHTNYESSLKDIRVCTRSD